MEGHTKMDSKIRAKITVNCPYFDFQQFPFDEQLCSLHMRPRITGQFSLAGSIFLSKTFDIAKSHLQYTIRMENVSTRSPDDFEYTQKYSSISVTFHMKRNIYPYFR